ncbi:MAG TPA: hypothetical protein VK631_00575, partial [Solirubrobacteraceae bacterium]|nr:hypothetical protein [Solirubrobacteraceae bacterium]
MVLFALSFQGQVEKYGAYVGIAAFFGLAVLSLLYFSQARELKRLREWAGRAPERARELEQRVVAQATATVARRAPARAAGGGIAPPRRLAEMPAGAQAALGTPATELADPVSAPAAPGEADPVTNGNVPAPVPPVGPGGSVPAGPAPANGAAPGVAATAAGQAASPNGGAAVACDDAPALPDEGAETGAPVARADGGASAPPGEGAETGAPAADDGAQSGAAVADDGAAGVPGETQPAGFPAALEEEPVPGEVPPAVPRATPAQRVGVTPRPAPMPLRQTKPSATPRGAAGRRPPAPPAGRRPAAKPPREGRSAGTIALLVGLAVLILGGGTFVGSQLLGGDDTPPAPNVATPPPTETETDAGSGNGGGAPAAKPPAQTNVAVLNGTTFTGLAGQLADEVAADGYERG